MLRQGLLTVYEPGALSAHIAVQNSGLTSLGNPLFPFPDRLSSVFSALGEKANS
jgi:hypothetical protein